MKIPVLARHVPHFVAYGWACILGVLGILAFGFWLLSEPEGVQKCTSKRDEGLTVSVEHGGMTGKSVATVTYKTSLLTQDQVPTMSFWVGGPYRFDRDGKVTGGGIGISGQELAAQGSEMKSDRPVHFSERFSEPTFLTFDKALFPFDSQIGVLEVTAVVEVANGRKVSIDTPDAVCIRTERTFRARFPEPVGDGSKRVIFRVERQTWFQLVAICAVLLVWVPFVAAWRSSQTHIGLELIATITYAAAIRHYLTRDSEPFVSALLDVAIFLPILFLAMLSLVRAPELPRKAKRATTTRTKPPDSA